MKPPLHTLLEISAHILKNHPELIPQLEEAITKARGGRQIKNFAPAGHYYSPVVDPESVAHLFVNHAMDVSLEGVELNVEGQMELWRLMVPFLLEVPFPIQRTEKYRYFSENDWYGLGDAAVYFALIRLFKPKRIIEIGSGFSSAVALDTSDQFLNGMIDFTFIDPYPDRLRLLLGAHDESKLKVLTHTVQTIPLEEFAALDSGDILFIDSTHILKTGSDVSFELFSVLPSLKPGVFIHFHDTFWPFEYPKEWVIDDNRSWNELYALRAFLMNNPDYEILFFNHYFAKVHHEKVLSECPNLAGGLGGGLWLRKIR
jgi:hypothetical protein